MRYATNRGVHDCVPVALVNAIKWTGTPISYRAHYPSLLELFEVEKNKGVFLPLLDKFLKTHKEQLPFKVIKVKQGIDIKVIKAELSKGRAVLLGVVNSDRSHIALVTHMTDYYATIINFRKGTRKHSISRLKKYLNKNSIGYIIEK